MIHNKVELAKGTILIAEPSLNDVYFERSIVLIAEHNKEGSYGLILNKPTDVKLHEVTKDIMEFDAQLYLGGPVNTDNLYIIHRIGLEIEGSIEIINGLYWGGNLDDLKTIIRENPDRKKDIQFYVGYSSWEENQLEEEIKENSWIINHASTKHIFNNNPQKAWGELIKSFGEDYAIWSNYPSNPILN